MFILNKEIVRKIFSRSIAKVVAILSLTSLVQAAQFHLPAGTPGLQAGLVQQNINANPVNCEHIIVPGTTCHLYFPIDGSQPTTAEAGQYSGARYDNPDNNRVTDWWVRVFGGNMAVKQINNGMNDLLMGPRMGFKINGYNSHIIRVNTRNIPAGFERQFWQAFSTIAVDPVGRVLLYRLLIEIRRINEDGSGCYEGNFAFINARNSLRSIEIRNTNNGFEFVYAEHSILFNLNDKPKLTLHVDHIKSGIVSKAEERPNDVALFHEMLHWFHFLRNIPRVVENMRETAAAFKYTMRCYYGDQSELCIWGANCNAEEIATILGAPDYNKINHLACISPNSYLELINKAQDSILIINNGIRSYIPISAQFLNGDDLSENAYRCSQRLHMRFGHTDQPANLIDFLNPPLRYQLAHIVAVECYTEIRGQRPVNWQFRPGEAINR